MGGGGLWNLCAAEGTADPGNQNDNDDKSSCYLLIDLLPAVCLLPTWLQSTRMGPSNNLLLILRTPWQWGRNLDPSVTSEMEKSRVLNSLKTLSCLGRLLGGGLARSPRAECCVPFGRTLDVAKPQIPHPPNGQRVPALATSPRC